jgi:perosamine synthetase
MQMRPFFGQEEREALIAYDFEDGFLTEFRETVKFESQLMKYLGVENVAAVNNGTVAITLSILALGVSAGDEVIIPNFTMIATPNAVKLVGAKPVFADVEKKTWCIDRAEIFKKITKKTKAVILVAANGRFPTYDVDELRVELNELGIMLIEDAAQSLGSTFSDGSSIGTKGNIATLSFSPPKIISTGQGGLVFSRDEKVMQKVKHLKDFGRATGGTDIHNHFGINAKFTDIQAIIGIAQLKKLNYRIHRRKEQHRLYCKYLDSQAGVEIPDNNLEKTCPWFTEILVSDPDSVSKQLKDIGVGSRRVYPEINKQKIYEDSKTHVASKYISDHGLWLPSHMGVSDKDIKIISEKVNEICSN